MKKRIEHTGGPEMLLAAQFTCSFRTGAAPLDGMNAAETATGFLQAERHVPRCNMTP